MKSSRKHTNPHILLFWSLPSISMIDAYKDKCRKLNQAIQKVKSVEIVTSHGNTLKLNKIGNESGRFFGLNNVQGNIKKTFLNVNNIKAITLL